MLFVLTLAELATTFPERRCRYFGSLAMLSGFRSTGIEEVGGRRIYRYEQQTATLLGEATQVLVSGNGCGCDRDAVITGRFGAFGPTVQDFRFR